MPSPDPEYQKRYNKGHYERNKEYYKEKARKRQAMYREYYRTFIRRYKKQCGCSSCGIKDHRVLDFHHLRDKVSSVSSMGSRQRPIKVIKEEIRKCEVLCANCHRIHHS